MTRSPYRHKGPDGKNRCSFCRDKAVARAPGQMDRGRIVRFCEECLMLLVAEAVKVLGETVKRMVV